MIKKSRYITFCAILIIIIINVIVFHRMLLSVELTDESHGIASIINIIQGKKPFISSWDYHTGWCLLAPLYSFYIKLNNGSNEGIVLFSRILYLAVYIIAASIIFIMKYKSGDKTLSIVYLGMATWVPFSIYQLNYNSFTVILLLLTISLVDYLKEDSQPIVLSIPGVIFGLTCINYPTMIIYGIILALLILYRNGIKKFLYFSIGVCIVGLVFIIWLMHDSSFEILFTGVEGMLNSPHEASKASINIGYLRRTFRECKRQ